MKRVFPVFWFGFLAVFATTAILRGDALEDAPFLIGPVAMAVFGFVLLRKLIWDLADEVEDHGDWLRVRRGSVEERVNLVDVMNVSMNQFSNPRRLSLRLRKPGAFGDEIVFIPQTKGLRLNPFARNPIAESLIERVDRLRSGASR
jgi:hypothetical protein